MLDLTDQIFSDPNGEISKTPLPCLSFAAKLKVSILFTGRDDLTRVRTEFLSISKCPHLEQIATGSLATLKDLKTLTINENPSLKYIAPGFIEDAPKLAAIDLSQNSLYALEYSALETVILKLRALYLNGNKFNCHCSLRYVKKISFPNFTTT